MKHYLERMKIADAKRLADRLGLPVAVLLEASFSLSQDVRELDPKRISDLPQLRDLDVSVAV